MGCWEKPIWNEYTREELHKLRIPAVNEAVRREVMKNWDLVAKPLDGLGKFEEMFAQIGAIIGSAKIKLSKKAVIIMCADNGVVEEGVSQCGQEVTAAVAEKMATGSSGVGRMAAVIGADTIPVDIGINKDGVIQGLINKRIRQGTRNFMQEPAMTESEMLRAIAVGMEIVEKCKSSGYDILATGEMGIGNTTTSSAIVAAVLGCRVSKVTGRGAGLTAEGLLKKQAVIERTIKQYGLKGKDPLTVLQTVGGLDIAGLVGVCIGGALFSMPIVLDGVISMTAALLAEKILPGTRQYLLSSHRGKEPAMEILMQELGFLPVIDGNLALGEGTGAVMLFPLLDMVQAVYESSATFAGMQIEPYKRYDK